MHKLPVLVKAGLLIGTVSGGCVGLMLPPPLVGSLSGMIIGGICGLIAGTAMHRQDERERKRDLELDADIGVTRGSMGAPPGSIPPGNLEREPEEALELASWADEWLTPPPPMAR